MISPIRPILQQRQTTHTIVAFALHQSLQLLQMPQLELSQWLLAEIENNPLLELDTMGQTSVRHDFSTIESPLTLHEHLLHQIQEHFTQPQQHIAHLLLEALDERGFLECSLNALSHQHNLPRETFERVLPILQTFDPPGIFAQNLRECLLIQLQDKPNSDAYKIVSSHFEHLLRKRFEKIKKSLKIDDLSPAILTLARLHLRPSASFRQETPIWIRADLTMTKTGKTWIIETPEEMLPKFHLNTRYLTLSPDEPEEKKSLRKWVVQGKWLLKSLERRRLLLREVGALLARKQAAFLEQRGELQQITAQEIATKLQIHESTLSRALAGKYVQTPRGCIALKSLLSASPETLTAKEALQRLIAQENRKEPLSDTQLADTLQQSGIVLARRTIAKYRKELKISSAAQRKQRHKA
ncbi:MAG: RNA polymerase factor sigma-54 [Chlamydiia bacterium]|nr:RNA polymerase factor sigma-54 [Chlamydiia bacterium]